MAVGIVWSGEEGDLVRSTTLSGDRYTVVCGETGDADRPFQLFIGDENGEPSGTPQRHFRDCEHLAKTKDEALHPKS